MPLRFEWDREKAATNLRKHGVSFEEATTAFGDPLSMTIDDPAHSIDEKRFLLLGQTARRRLVVVYHTDDGGTIRIIGARLATRRELWRYEEET